LIDRVLPNFALSMRALRLTKINGISISQWLAGGAGIFVKWPHGGRTRLIVLPLGILSLSLVFIAETSRGRFSQHKTDPSRTHQSYPERHKQRIFISTVPLCIRFYSGKNVASSKSTHTFRFQMLGTMSMFLGYISRGRR
jgi:hypothetical protein